MTETPLLQVEDLRVRFSTADGVVKAVDGASYSVAAGKTLGIRSYTQTSGVWVRGILQDGFGLDLGSLKWVTFEGAHLDEYQDPAEHGRELSLAAPLGRRRTIGPRERRR